MIKEKCIPVFFGAIVLIQSQEFFDMIYDNATNSNDTCYDCPCPENWTIFDNMCYVLDPSACPYRNPLPFELTKNIVRNVSSAKLNIVKIKDYDYFQWREILGNYDKLFNLSLDGLYEQVAVNYTQENATSYFTLPINDFTFSYVCAYDNFINNTRHTYCENFDKICENNSISRYRTTTNCHCRNRTGHFFCELDCDWKEYNETVCVDCQTILEDYDRPQLALSFSYERSIIFIEIQSYRKLLPLQDDNLVYCFTDAEKSLHDVTYRYDFNNNQDLIENYNDSYSYLYYFIYPRNYSLGHYWCKAFAIDEREIKSDTIIAPGTNYFSYNLTSSFTMNITVLLNETNPYPLTIHEKTQTYIENIVNQTDFIKHVRFLHLYKKNKTANTTKIAYRLYTIENNTEDMNDILQKVKNIFVGDEISLSPSYCLPEITLMGDFNLTWPATLLGMTVLPKELCLQDNREPVTRTCLGEYLYGTFWSEVEGTCVNNSGELYGSKKTIPFHNLTLSGDKSAVKLENLKKLLPGTTQPISVDVHFVAKILENVTRSSDNHSLNDLIQVASDFMDLDRRTLRKAQLKLNTTDEILYNIDFALVSNESWTSEEFFHIKTKNIYVQVSRIFVNITGAAFYDNGDDIRIVPIYENMTETLKLQLKDLRLAAFINSKQMEQLRDLNHDENLKNETKLVVVLYRKDSLFNDHYEPTITGYQVGFYVTGFEEPFMYDYVWVLFKPNRKYRARLSCISWMYGMSKLWYNERGRWAREVRSAKPVEDLFLCRYKHMTHYGILVNVEGSIALSIITIIGCALSALGSLGVIITAVIYRTWRENSGTKVLLNFVATIILENCVLAVSGSVDSYKEESACIFIGALLHYCVGAQFSWMLVIGYLQYQRYVKVFFTVNTYFVIGASIIAWGLPIIPVITILIIDKEYYIQDNYCYLVEKPLYFGVFLPVSVILTINIFIFSIILTNVCSKTKSTINSHMRDSLSMLHLRLIILLFFLLGLYWIFGISARFLQSVALDYFFCISAALQGLVMFLYFIIFNRMTKNFWLRQLKRSQMLASMQTWLQHKSKAGNVELGHDDVTKQKIKIQKMLTEAEKMN